MTFLHGDACRLESEYPARAKVLGVNHTAPGPDHVIFPIAL
jgi:hypothetical protein